jgi:hypothetical protein
MEYGKLVRSLIPATLAFGFCNLLVAISLFSVPRPGQSLSMHLPATSTPDSFRLSFLLSAVEQSPPEAITPARCRIHGTTMKAELVPVRYGLPLASESFLEHERAADVSFPHCDDPIEGGCVVDWHNVDFKDVCRECNAARDDWLHDRAVSRRNR